MLPVQPACIFKFIQKTCFAGIADAPRSKLPLLILFSSRSTFRTRRVLKNDAADDDGTEINRKKGKKKDVNDGDDQKGLATLKADKGGKKGAVDRDDDGDDEDEDVTPVNIPLTDPVAVSDDTPAPAPTNPVAVPDDTPAPAPTLEPTEDIYRIVSCGDLPEEVARLEISYLYNLRTSDKIDADSEIVDIEAETLKAVSSEFVACESDRRRLNALVAVSAFPADIPSGSCGSGCTSVVGGMTMYVEDQGENANWMQLHCQVLSIIRNTMIEIESRPSSGVDQIDFVDDEDLDCEETLEGRESSQGRDSFRGIQGLAEDEVSQGGDGITIGAMAGIAASAAAVAALAFMIILRRRHSDDGTAYISVASDKDDDLRSVMTPETTTADSRLTPPKLSPERGFSIASLPPTPEHETLVYVDGSPIAQFNPDLLDATNKASNNVFAENYASGVAGSFGTVGFGDAVFGRFKPPAMKKDPVNADGRLGIDDSMDDGAVETVGFGGAIFGRFKPPAMKKGPVNKGSRLGIEEFMDDGAVETVGFGAAIFGRLFKQPAVKKDPVDEVVGRGIEDFMYDNDDDDRAVLMEESESEYHTNDDNEVLGVSPMLAMWQKSAAADEEEVSSLHNCNLILSAIPEDDDESDEQSVETAEVSNISQKPSPDCSEDEMCERQLTYR